MAVSNENRKMWDELHNRLISGDVIASAEIAEYFMPLLIGKLNRAFQNIDDPHLIETAVIDTLMDYLSKPNQYDPRRGNLLSFLILKAKSDLLNLLSPKKIDQVQVDLAEIVELDNDSSVYGVELIAEMEVEELITKNLSPIWNRLSSIIPDRTDQEIVKLMMDGIRETNIFAEVMGIQNLPDAEQSRVVKQNKDRLKKVIQRHIRTEELKNE
jgi:RNA polymerase sigma-70 factor (ECF subfamily)